MQRQGSGGKSKGKQAAMDVRMSGGDSSASQSDDETMAIVISDSDDESEEEEEVDPIARAAELKMTGNEYYKEKSELIHTHIYIYIYIYIYVCMCVCVCVYLYPISNMCWSL